MGGRSALDKEVASAIPEQALPEARPMIPEEQRLIAERETAEQEAARPAQPEVPLEQPKQPWEPTREEYNATIPPMTPGEGAGEIPTVETPKPEGGILTKKQIEAPYRSTFTKEQKSRLDELYHELGQTKHSTTAPTTFSDTPTLADKRWTSGIDDSKIVEEYNRVKNEYNQLKVLREQDKQRREFELKNRWEDAEKLGKIVYLRFGKPPKKSYNYRDSVELSGVSVYRTIEHGQNRYEIEPKISYLLSGPGLHDRALYKIVGRKIGIGSDGEPIVDVIGSELLSGVSVYHPVGGWFRTKRVKTLPKPSPRRRKPG